MSRFYWNVLLFAACLVTIECPAAAATTMSKPCREWEVKPSPWCNTTRVCENGTFVDKPCPEGQASRFDGHCVERKHAKRCKFGCTEGAFETSYNCSQYYRCVNWQNQTTTWISRACAPGTFFHEGPKSCRRVKSNTCRYKDTELGHKINHCVSMWRRYQWFCPFALRAKRCLQSVEYVYDADLLHLMGREVVLLGNVAMRCYFKQIRYRYG